MSTEKKEAVAYTPAEERRSREEEDELDGWVGRRKRPATLAAELVEWGASRLVDGEFGWLRHQLPSCREFFQPYNYNKNNFANQLLWDETRVVLADQFYGNNPNIGDYAHASYVDGIDCIAEYILAQTPLTARTIELFYRMVLMNRVTTVAVLSTPRQGLVPFWPVHETDNNKFQFKCGQAICQLQVSYATGRGGGDVEYCEVRVAPAPQALDPPAPYGKSQAVNTTFIHYKSWTDDKDIPKNLRDYLERVRLHQLERREQPSAVQHQQEESEEATAPRAGQLSQSVSRSVAEEEQLRQQLQRQQTAAAAAEAATHEQRPYAKLAPLLICCDTGIHRSATLAAVDICVRRLRSFGTVDIEQTVRALRTQRYGSLQHAGHYAYLTSAVLAAGISDGLLPASLGIDFFG